MQTAVEWLFSKLWNTTKDKFTWYAILEQAKQMEREQHGKTWDSAIEQCEKRAWNLSRLYTDFDDYFAETYGSKGSDDHIVDTNEMVKRGTLKKRMDKDAWFVVFQSNAYNESDMAYELIKSQEIDIDMYDVYKDGDEVTFELVKKKWAKITPFLYPLKTTSSQTEISDEEIEKFAEEFANDYAKVGVTENEVSAFFTGMKKYREQLKQRQ